MLNRWIFYILTLNLILTAGCVSTMNQGQAPFEQGRMEKEVVELPERIPMTRNDLPGDAELVMAAMINVIRGSEEKIPQISFDRNGSHGFLEEDFFYKGFDVEHIDLIYFKTEKAVDNVRYAMLECGLYFADAIGRSAYVRVLAEYAVAKKDIIITQTEYEILPNPYPKVFAFIVPRDTVDVAPAEVKNDFRRLFLLAQKNAVTMEPTPQERARYESYKQLSSMGRLTYQSEAIPRSHYVMVFCMERLRPESRFAMTISRDAQASENSLSIPYYLNDNGWMVGIAGGKFAVDDYGKELFFHVRFNPGIDPKNTKLKSISRFSSIKEYNTNRPPEPPNPYLEGWKKQGIDPSVMLTGTAGPISSGTRVLNPSIIEDAKKIQQRLADSGFYNQKIDGAFGKGSKKSLTDFKKAKGLGNDSIWNLETQKALFSGSGL